MWAIRGYCDSIFYPEQVMRRYCALSCGYCRQRPRFLPDSMEEPVPRQPFADEPTPRSRENTTHKSRKTTTTASPSEEEFVIATTSEPNINKSDEDSTEHKKSKKGRKRDD